jgi:hypothetical protein
VTWRATISVGVVASSVEPLEVFARVDLACGWMNLNFFVHEWKLEEGRANAFDERDVSSAYVQPPTIAAPNVYHHV